MITSSDADQLRDKVASYDAAMARLEAELAGTLYDPGPVPSEPTSDPGQLAQQRAASYSSRLRDFDAQTGPRRRRPRRREGQADAAGAAHRRAQGIDDMRSSLFGDGQRLSLNYLQGRDEPTTSKQSWPATPAPVSRRTQMLGTTGGAAADFIEDFRRFRSSTLSTCANSATRRRRN